MSQGDAMTIIRERSGNFYDPSVVAAFERVYRELVPTAISQPRLQHVMHRIRRVRETAPSRWRSCATSASIPPSSTTPIPP